MLSSRGSRSWLWERPLEGIWPTNGYLKFIATQIQRRIAAVGDKVYCLLGTNDGEKIASWDLPAPPVWDGLAAARGDCIIALKDGTVVCLP